MLTLQNAILLLIKSVLNKVQSHYYYNIFLEKWNVPANWLNNNEKNVFDSIIMLRFGEKKAAKEKCYAAKEPINIWDVNIDNIAISKLVETKNNSRNFIEYLDKVIGPLILILPKMKGYIKTSKVKDKNIKLMSFPIIYEKLLQKYETIWFKIKDLKILNWMIYQSMMIDI